MGDVKTVGNVIMVTLDETDPRVCDYCNELLVSYDEDEQSPTFHKLVAVKRCHSTDYGLMCDECKGKEIEAFRTWEAGQTYDNPY